MDYIPDAVEKTGEALTKFDILELALIFLTIVTIVAILKIGPSLVKAWIAKSNNDNKQLTEENNMLLKNIGARFEPIEEVLNKLMEENKEREKRQKDVDVFFAETRQDLQEIKGEIDVLSETVSKHAHLNLSQSKGIFENMIFNTSEQYDAFRRLKALRRFFGLKGNGDGKEEGYRLVLANQKEWKRVLALKMKLTIIDYAYYRKAIEEINNRVFDHGLTIEPDDFNAEIIEYEIIDD